MFKRILFLTLALISLTFLSQKSIATVGGPWEMKVLGWDAKYKYLILMLEHNGEGSVWHDLFMYHLPSRTLTTLKEVSYAMNDLVEYNQALEHLKSRLIKPIPLNLQKEGLKFRTKVLGRSKKNADTYYKDLEGMDFYNKEQCAILKNGKILTQTVVRSYPGYKRPTKLISAYQIKDQLLQFFIVRYLGQNYEMGYTIDTPLLIPPKKKENKIIPRVYTIQVTSSKNKESLQKEFSSLKGKGFCPTIQEAVITKDGKKEKVYRLRVGYYLFKEEAEEEAKKIGKKVWIAPIKFPYYED